jgi:nucleosome binding factor SPN SPT16 subunit
MRAGAGNAEARRKVDQDDLGARKNEETLRRLTEANRRNAEAASTSGAAQDFVAYRSPADVPSERAREALIVVDRPKEAVLLPIYGQLVPFHIGTIKNCTATQEGVAHFIRIHFNVPGAAFGGAGYAPAVSNPDATFLREITFRSADGRHASNIVSEIKSLRTAAKQRATEAAERATLVRQDKLQLAKGRVHRLADVWVRPAFGGRGRKLSGTLECHANGFRYSTPKSEERLDIIFSNIKHAFFQPSEKELITLVHFHLIEPIMVGKKKTYDVQVFAEVMDAVQNLDGGRRSMYDPDEIEDEQRERERRNRVNADFSAFTKRVQELWEKDFNDLVRVLTSLRAACVPHATTHPTLTALRAQELEFDIPFRELAFPGVPYKTSSLVLPTVNCLVDLIETPFLVVTLKEIEVVNLERVGFALKNFDMAIVFKDFTKEVHRIDAIDSKNLDTIKEWLNSVGIKYYESKMNLNWKPILKTILVRKLDASAARLSWPAWHLRTHRCIRHAGRSCEVCGRWRLGLPGPGEERRRGRGVGGVGGCVARM